MKISSEKKSNRYDTILDLSPDKGFSYYWKNSLFTFIEKRNRSLKIIKCEPKSIIDQSFYLPNLRILSQTPKIIFDSIFALKIIFHLIFKTSSNRENFLSKYLNIRFKGIQVGDCILSVYFRRPSTPLVPKKSVGFLIFTFISLLNIGYQLRQIHKKCEKINTFEIMFFNWEITGWHEIWRRFLSTRGALELRHSIFHQSYRLFSGFSGATIKRGHIFRKKLYDNLSKQEIVLGKEVLKKLVHREKKYVYLRSFDINPSQNIAIKPFSRKSTVVLFLATVSDAQYSLGIGPYPDLISFQSGIINFAIRSGYNVVIKPHPNMFKDNDFAYKDRQYYQSLRSFWQPDKVTTGLERSKIKKEVFFVDYTLSSIELSKVFPDFMCVTQHGTVATECAYNNLFTLVGSNSRYSVEEKFVKILTHEKELSELFEEWQRFSGYSLEERESLYKFSYITNVGFPVARSSLLLKGIMPDTLDSWQIESWLENFASQQKNRDIVVRCLEKYTKEQGVDLDNIISFVD